MCLYVCICAHTGTHQWCPPSLMGPAPRPPACARAEVYAPVRHHPPGPEAKQPAGQRRLHAEDRRLWLCARRDQPGDRVRGGRDGVAAVQSPLSTDSALWVGPKIGCAFFLGEGWRRWFAELFCAFFAMLFGLHFLKPVFAQIGSNFLKLRKDLILEFIVLERFSHWGLI